MNKRPLCYLPTLLILLLLSCTTPPTTMPPPAATITPTPPLLPEAEAGLNFLITTAETVQLQRRFWPSYQPVAFGTHIQRGDLILPPTDQPATILCADLTIHELAAESGSPCQVTAPKLTYEGARVVTPRSAIDTIPYILYPRNTSIIDPHPLLRWHDTDASGYTVAIIAGGEAIWEQTGVTTTEIRYPDDAPPLAVATSYLLEIRDETTGKSSTEDPVKGLGFRLLSAEMSTQIAATEAEIHALSLAPPAQQFAQAIYYAGQGLHGDALTLLDTVAQTHDAPAIQLWRGHLLLATRLYSQAETAYSNALTLATTLGDLETQAQSHTGLWRATKTTTHFDNAISLYQQLNDEQAVTDLQNER